MKTNLDNIVAQIDNQMDVYRGFTYDTKWDAVVDSGDDCKHLVYGHHDSPEERIQLLRDTLSGYIYPDGHCYYEGMGILRPGGDLISRLNSAIDEDGEPIDAEVFRELNFGKPWLEEPWLPDYSFITRFFEDNPEEYLFASGIIPAKGRNLIVLASRYDSVDQGPGAVFVQISAQQIFQDVFSVKEGEKLFLCDFEGRLGFSTDYALAQKALGSLKGSGSLEEMLAQGKAGEEAGELGAGGRLSLVLDGKDYTLTYRTVESNYLLGHLQDDEQTNALIMKMASDYHHLSYLAMGLLFATSLLYTAVTLRKEKRIMSLETDAEYSNRLQKAFDGTIQAIAVTLEKRDSYTAGHQREVANLALAIAREMGLDEEVCKGVHVAGYLHDIGKIGIPRKLLAKTEKLTDDEFNIIRQHPLIGYDILSQVEFPWPVAIMVRQHHERINGKGYPMQECGENILIGSRILGVADTVEAMSNPRPYRPNPPGLQKAIEEIEFRKGTFYDEDVVDACRNIILEGRFTF